MGDEFLTRPRLSRIYYDGKFFSYPLTSKDVVGRLGLFESARCTLSYLWAQRHARPQAETFEDWVTARFGRRLYDAFFRSYTEKVWGIPAPRSARSGRRSGSRTSRSAGGCSRSSGSTARRRRR